MSQLPQPGRPSTLVVLAKAPIPGFVKTRLCPPCTPAQAAVVAEASLLDTIDAVASCRSASVRVLAIDTGPDRSASGEPVAGVGPPRWKVIGQRPGPLDHRLAGAFDDVLSRPESRAGAFLVGMDTPQLSADLLAEALEALAVSDAVIGPATDGGYWGIGLRVAEPMVFLGVPMSVPDTYRCQYERLVELGLRVAVLPELRDVDTYEDALAVAAASPRTRLAAVLGADRTTGARNGAVEKARMPSSKPTAGV